MDDLYQDSTSTVFRSYGLGLAGYTCSIRIDLKDKWRIFSETMNNAWLIKGRLVRIMGGVSHLSSILRFGLRVARLLYYRHAPVATRLTFE